MSIKISKKLNKKKVAQILILVKQQGISNQKE